ncbi:MAG: PilZ domain-containing protein [Gammaproteobacteria bacterium]|nr:MAG: PilZ domain-containing protein [Gammaproteobacteria bacterium]
MLDYQEKRQYPRMEIECPACFTIEGQAGQAGAIVKNLSGGGLLMWLEQSVPPGALLSIRIDPPSDITPPMKARVKVLRCTPVEGVEGQFAVACQTEEILP